MKENTVVSYLYRDASNYKQLNNVVVAGTFTEADLDEIRNALRDDEYFIPSQVGLPEERFGEINSDDHVWFELDTEYGFVPTDAEPDVSITAAELVDAFRNVATTGWDEESAARRAGIMTETTLDEQIVAIVRAAHQRFGSTPGCSDLLRGSAKITVSSPYIGRCEIEAVEFTGINASLRLLPDQAVYCEDGEEDIIEYYDGYAGFINSANQ